MESTRTLRRTIFVCLRRRAGTVPKRSSWAPFCGHADAASFQNNLILARGCRSWPVVKVIRSGFIDKEFYTFIRSSCHWTRSCTNPFDPVVIDDIGAASGFGAPIGIQTDACPRHPEDCGLWRFHKCGIAAGRSANACAAAFPEKARKRSVWLPSARGFFVPLKVLASRWVLADFHKPDRSNGGTQNSPASCIERPPGVRSIVRGCTPNR